MSVISASAVKELREMSGAGMMDCKNALKEASGNLEEAIDILRKSGIAKARKKSGRSAKEGLIFPYIHPGSKLGVLLEINCETDFVANTDDFKDLSKDIAMHIAASAPMAITREEIPQEVLDREKEIYAEQARQSGKPENIIEKMIEGRLNKFYQENVLMEQAFVKDPDKTVQDMLTETVAKLGENILITRFVRYQLGESAENSDPSNN
ncbi:MAG: translation elongation factor Ts [Candidatus Marinimicrobia bacterium]|jgi:elongation factor Ts|nr:translation elongation factor Ts [Candidatus Neomarinimicrobiota bacterium]MDP6852611.1 translation elongation factor Ts [Candidatus Neomarinimicrobiota bacterium]